MQAGCYTALITPFAGDGSVDYAGLEKLVHFQAANQITGIVAVGTTGESPTLNWDEHHRVIDEIASQTRGVCLCIAGTGSNNTAETLAATERAVKSGIDGVLLVDPYYNGPSSLEIRREYIAPVASRFPRTAIIPYVVPGRTGAQLLPEDLAILANKYANVRSVKEATGNLDNMRRTRTCCGPDFVILSGDDGITFQMMTDPDIKAAGVISVISNIAPKAVGDMVNLLIRGNTADAEKIALAMAPLFDLVTVKSGEKTPFGEVTCRARNPLPIKTMMRILGMPSGPCRQPLGKMTPNGVRIILDAVRRVHAADPQILAPAAEFFGIDIEERINMPASWEHLVYPNY